MVMPNLYGDFLSDMCAGLIGGLGLTPSGNIGRDASIFEAVHGSAPDIAGQNKANPLAAIRSAALMLRYLGYPDGADRIDTAVNTVLQRGDVLTPDLGGRSTTQEVVDEVLKRI